MGVAVPRAVTHALQQMELGVGIRSASSSPSCGGAWMSSANEITCTGTRTDVSRSRWS